MNLEALTQAARTINEGGVIAYPTESCYGLGCDPRCKDAVRRILRLKQRQACKGLILIAADISQLRPYLQENPGLFAKAANSWPGPVTWLLPASAWVPIWIRGDHESLAVRVTRHRIANALCRLSHRAIVSTSVNKRSHAPVRTATGVIAAFDNKIDYILDYPIGRHQLPSKIIDALTNAVIRE